MFRIRPVPVTRQVILRILADTMIISGTVLAAMIARFLYEIAIVTPNIAPRPLFLTLMRVYAENIWILVLVCLVVFALSGFYTHGRYYNSRYKAIILFQAVSLAFLTYGFIAFWIRGQMGLPRSTLVLSWVFSLVGIMAARLWATLWSRVVRDETQLPVVEKPTNKQRILVIGGAGYIGSALLPQLLNKGYKVRLFDLLLFGTGPIQSVLKHPNLEILQADFRQVDRVTEAMREVDAVIHLGAIVGDPACALDEQLTVEINLMGTRMIAEIAKGYGIHRFIFASTCSVYGAKDGLLDERSELNPVSLYARSKIASEKILLKMADRSFSPVILRFGTIFGLSGRTRFDLVVNLLTAKALKEKMITVEGGDQWRPFMHVEDAASAVLTALEAPLSLVSGQIFNAGSNDQNYTIRQVAELIRSRVPDAALQVKHEIVDRRNYRVEFSKIRNLLDFKPTWTLEQGVDQVIAAFESGKVKDYRDARYSNVKFLNEEGLHMIRPENGWASEMIAMPYHSPLAEVPIE